MLQTIKKTAASKGLNNTGKTFIGEIMDMAKAGFNLSSSEAVKAKDSERFFFQFSHPTKGEVAYINVSKGAVAEYGADIAALSALPVYSTPQMHYERDIEGNPIEDGENEDGTTKYKLAVTFLEDGKTPALRYIIGRPIANGGMSASELLKLATDIVAKQNAEKVIKPAGNKVKA